MLYQLASLFTEWSAQQSWISLSNMKIENARLLTGSRDPSAIHIIILNDEGYN